MLRLVGIFFVLFITGCTSMADSFTKLAGVGVVSKEVSDFDGSKIVRVSPAHLYNPNAGMLGMYTKLGGYWNSNTPELVALILENNSQAGYGQSYLSYQGLDINIDGKQYSYEVDGTTKFDNSGYNTVTQTIYTSSKNAVTIPYEVLKSMMTAKDCRIRINTGNGSETAMFSTERIPGGQSTAILHFREFIQAVEGDSPQSTSTPSS